MRSPTRHQTSDEDLVERLHAGDEGALSELYARYSVRALHYFQRMLGDLETAQDALQELFLKLIDARARICPEKKFASWLFAVAHHMCCNEYRSRDVRSRALTRLAFEAPTESCFDLDGRIDDDSFAQRLQAELARLDMGHRSAFLLRHQEGLSIRQISAILGCPPGTVKSRVHYACRRLAEKLGSFDPREPEDHCYETHPQEQHRR